VGILTFSLNPPPRQRRQRRDIVHVYGTGKVVAWPGMLVRRHLLPDNPARSIDDKIRQLAAREQKRLFEEAKSKWLEKRAPVKSRTDVLLPKLGNDDDC
jgi:hypothetical protein